MFVFHASPAEKSVKSYIIAIKSCKKYIIFECSSNTIYIYTMYGINK